MSKRLARIPLAVPAAALAATIGVTTALAGTGASKDNGTISATYRNSTHVLSWSKTGGTLHFYKVEGCSGLIRGGDSAALTGPFSVSPPQSITSP